MKNVILTHNELQLNLFTAFSYGLMQLNPATLLNDQSQKLEIIYDISETNFMWKVIKKDARPSEGALFFHYINKGEYRMNDIRPGVTTEYLREQAVQFLIEFKVCIDGPIKEAI